MRQLWVCLLCIACEAKYPVPPVDGGSVVSVDARELDPVEVPSCTSACANLRKLKCPEGEPTSSGATCEKVCTNARDLLDVDCVALATTVEGVKACRVRCIP